MCPPMIHDVQCRSARARPAGRRRILLVRPGLKLPLAWTNQTWEGQQKEPANADLAPRFDEAER